MVGCQRGEMVLRLIEREWRSVLTVVPLEGESSDYSRKKSNRRPMRLSHSLLDHPTKEAGKGKPLTVAVHDGDQRSVYSPSANSHLVPGHSGRP